MFCPQCRVEYRPGFTRCSDCDVDLVHELPLVGTDVFESRQDISPGDDEEDPFCSFWKGDDGRLHAELCTVLDDAGIPHKTVRRQDHLFNLNNYPAFQIGVPFSQFERAENAVQNAYGGDAQPPDPAGLLPFGKDLVADMGTFSPLLDAARGYASAGPYIPGALHPDETASSTPQPQKEEKRAWDPQDWLPEDATIEVWSGDQSYQGEIIALSLQENQIHSRFEKSAGRNAIWVLSEDEARAREIVREIVEGAPPE